MSHAADARAEQWSRLGLAEALRWAVPLKAAELLRHPPHLRRRRLPHGTVAYLGLGDGILFKGKRWQNAALAFDAYAWALAYLAVSNPGGVTRFGVHWCAGGHDGCPHDDRPAPAGPWWEPLAELEELARAEGFTPVQRPAPAAAPAPPAPRRVETLHLPRDPAGP